MMNPQKISIIVPTLNEVHNVQSLVLRINATFNNDKSLYEIIFIDDNSTDGTYDVLKLLELSYPVSSYLKKGKPGKAYSLLEGFTHAKFELIGYIDADLQYPPEVIPEMIEKIRAGEADIIVANRQKRNEGALRNLASKSFTYIFGKFLHGLDCDVQSGLKVFKSKIIQEITVNPSQWTFDLEFLLNSRNAGYTIGSTNIIFDERKHGESKIKFLKAIWEIGSNAIVMRFTKNEPVLILPSGEANMIGAGIAKGGKRYITHTTLDSSISAFITFTPIQKVIMTVGLSSLVAGFIFYPLATAIIFVSILSVIYFFDTIFSLFLVVKSMNRPPELNFEDDELSEINESNLPIYSILCPLYKEAAVLPGFLKAIDALDWPKNKLDVLLLLEANDPETIATAESMDLPSYVRTIVVPHSQPKTKPKACNYGLSLAHGKYIVIYDAEDIPEPNQLKKAYLAFQVVSDEVKCLQAKLNYFNENQNMLTRLFTAEYSLWFDIILPGLQSINTFIPLGGTSNHFRVKDLLEIKGWDPFNVTEDCDLGARLLKMGYRTAIIDSLTLEEANSHFGNWIRQRSRWIKGYMQTYLVHMRHPFQFIKDSGVHAFIFQLNIGMKTTFTLINPILWIATISYFAFRPIIGSAIEALYVGPIFYVAVFSLLFGNFMYLYNYMIGCAKREKWHLIKYVFFIPFYWLFMSVAAYLALWQLFVKPHFWEKTRHGLNLAEVKSPNTINIKDVLIEGKKALTPVPVYSRIRTAFNYYLPSSMSGHMSGAMVLMIAMMIANFLNFLFNAFLGRVLSLEEFGLIALVNTIWTLIAVVMNALSLSVNRQSAYLSISDSGSDIAFLQLVLKRGIFVALAISVLWIPASPLISNFFQISDPAIILLFVPIFVLGTIGAVSRGYLNGNLYLKSIAGIAILEAVSKFIIAFAFWELGFSNLVYIAIPASVILAAIISWVLVYKKTKTVKKKYTESFPFNFFSASLINGFSVTIFLSVDILLAKHFLSPLLAGQYALISLVGKMIFFLGSLPNFLITPLISRDEAASKNSIKSFRFIIAINIALSSLGFIFIGLFGYFTVPILLGSKSLPILPFLISYSLAMAIFTIANAIVVYYLVRKRYVFSFAPVMAAIIMVINILLRHGSVGNMVSAILYGSLFGLGTILALVALMPQFKFFHRAWIDFKNAFFKSSPVLKVLAGKQRILILNWRDTKHIFAGGAEMYVQEIAKEWVKDGHIVTIFSGNDGKNSEREIVGGVQIIRRGGFYLVYVWAFLYYFIQFRKRYDIIVDCHNGIPFFAPIYVREPVFCLMHHVHQEVFTLYLSRPLAAFARFLEKDLMPLVYKNVKIITVSESSKKEIKKIGLGSAGIDIVNPGVDLLNYRVGVKSTVPTILYLGRFKAYKSIDNLLYAFKNVIEKVPQAELILAGSGDEEKKLRIISRSLGILGNVKFAGKVSDEEKISLFQEAWVAVNPSLMEGWGITTIEANACGTPVVASDVPGLRDSVKDCETGLLYPYGDIPALSEKIISIIEDRKFREELGINAIAWAQKFTWDKSSENFINVFSNNFDALSAYKASLMEEIK
ncbi:MAG: glycosyltransferase [bacterium]|nr:glycosyltransferase [bacterium]